MMYALFTSFFAYDRPVRTACMWRERHWHVCAMYVHVRQDRICMCDVGTMSQYACVAKGKRMSEDLCCVDLCRPSPLVTGNERK